MHWVNHKRRVVIHSNSLQTRPNVHYPKGILMHWLSRLSLCGLPQRILTDKLSSLLSESSSRGRCENNVQNFQGLVMWGHSARSLAGCWGAARVLVVGKYSERFGDWIIKRTCSGPILKHTILRGAIVWEAREC